MDVHFTLIHPHYIGTNKKKRIKKGFVGKLFFKHYKLSFAVQSEFLPILSQAWFFYGVYVCVWH